jgi:hypothetical protein
MYDEALDMYSEAIFCKVPPKKKAIYYCNRALVNLRAENFGIALFGIFYFFLIPSFQMPRTALNSTQLLLKAITAVVQLI